MPIRKLKGFSLVEMMVALTIGLIILAAISYIFVASRLTYSTQDNLSRLQENARFAVHYLTRDIRLAGFSGCNEDHTSIKSQLDNTASAFAFAFRPTTAVEGINNITATSTWSPSAIAHGLNTATVSVVTGTDAITFRSASHIGDITLTKSMGTESEPLQVNSTVNLRQHDIVMIGDCINTDVFQVSNDPALTPGVIQHATGVTVPGPGNANATLSAKYLVENKTKFFRHLTRTYFIGNRIPNDNVPRLMVLENSGVGNSNAALELIEGVENMQILYGVDTDATPDGIPNIYVTASAVADWTRVRAVRIGLLMRTIAGNEEFINNETYQILDANFTAPSDRFQRRVFTLSGQLRNLL